MTTTDPLQALEARLAQDLCWLDLPAPSWVPPREADGTRVLDVAIVGGGMAGNRGVGRTAPARHRQPVRDRPRAGRLRRPVGHVRADGHAALAEAARGAALGLPALTFRAWFEAQYGRDAWDALYKIPRTQWMDYLRWYRRVLDLQVRNDTTLVALRPRDDGLLALDVRGNGEAQTLLARHVVLATGRDGPGGPTYRPSRNARRARWAPFVRADRFRGARGQASRRGRRGRVRVRQRGHRARSRRRARRPVLPPHGHSAHQQADRHRQPGARAWVRRSRRRDEMALHALRADVADAAAARQRAARVASRTRALSCGQPDRDARGTCGRTRRDDAARTQSTS